MFSSRSARGPLGLAPLVLAALLLPPESRAAGGGQEPDLPSVPVAFPDDAADELPPPSEWSWNLIADVQIDGVPATSVASEDVDRIDLRRARISAIVDRGFDWRLRISGDLGKYRGLRDLSLEYRGFPVYVAVGRMIEPFGLLQGSSSGAAFMERPQPMVLGPGYGVGVAASAGGERWGAAAGAFDATQNDVELGGREESAYTGRLTLAPYRSEAAVFHIGAAASRRDSGEGFIRFDGIPESTMVDNLNIRSFDDFFADGSSPGENTYRLYGGELAGRLGPVLLQSEYLRVTFDHVNTRAPSGELVRIASPVFWGYYAEASWAITGEQRDYSVRRGMFGNIYPIRPWGFGGLGAVEVATRFSRTSMIFGTPYHDPAGDRGWIGSIGMNWYATDTLKLMLEGVQIERERQGDGRRTERREWLAQARVQWYFLLP